MTDFSVKKKIGRLGWCPHTGPLQKALTESSPSRSCEEQTGPDGSGDGGPNRDQHGARLAADSVKFLFKNKKLLWFSLLTGLVTLFVFAAHYIWHVLARYPYNLIIYPEYYYPQYIVYYPPGLLLTFAVEFAAVLCMVFLLAGLVPIISTGKSGREISIREGFSKIRDRIRPLAGWSFIMAVAGTLIYIFLQYSGYLPHFIHRMLDQFPFYFIITPEVHGRGPIAGGFHTETALTSTIILMAVNVLLIILTIYVVPAIVLEKRRLPEAVAGVVPFLRKTWGETLVCFLTIGLIVSGAALLSLLFRVVYRITAPDQSFVWYPGNAWMAGAVLFMIVLCAFVFASSTAGGIAGLKIYLYGKTVEPAGKDEWEAAT